MMHCPSCREEFRDGFTTCADCGNELVPGDLPGELRPHVDPARVALRSRGRRLILVGLIGVPIALMLVRQFDGIPAILFGLLALAAFICFPVGSTLYAEAKGYSSSVGLVGLLGVFGFLILLALPERNEAPNQRSQRS